MYYITIDILAKLIYHSNMCRCSFEHVGYGGKYIHWQTPFHFNLVEPVLSNQTVSVFIFNTSKITEPVYKPYVYTAKHIFSPQTDMDVIAPRPRSTPRHVIFHARRQRKGGGETRRSRPLFDQYLLWLVRWNYSKSTIGQLRSRLSTEPTTANSDWMTSGAR